MTGAEAATQARLNPFAFPSETTLRFVLLVVFALCGSSGQYGVLWDITHRQEEKAADACTANVLGKLSHLAFTPDTVAEVAKAARSEMMPEISACSRLLGPRAIWQVAGMLITACLTAWLYWLIPILIIRTARLQPVTPDEPPLLQAELQSLCSTAAGMRAPRLLWNPLGTGMPLVFGSRGRNCLAFSGAFVSQLYGDIAAFCAIVLHELAHIHCRDIGKTYLTIATCAAFLVATLAPILAVSPFFELRWSDAPDVLIYSLLWTGAILLAGTSVLRAREHYADVQASAWDATPANIDRILGTLPEAANGRWRRFIRFHPSAAERRKVVADPSRLFAFGAADAIAVGIATSLVMSTLKGTAAEALPNDITEFALMFAFAEFAVPACILVFAVGAVGIGVWRGAFASLVNGEDAGRTAGRLGLALGMGLAVPAVLSIMRAALLPAAPTSLPFLLTLQACTVDLAIAVIVAAGCFLVFRWIADAVAAWLDVVLHSHSPWPVLLSSVLSALVLVVVASWSAYFAVYFYSAGGFRNASSEPIMYSLVAGPPIVLGSVLVWAFPMAAGRWRGRYAGAGSPACWVFLGRADVARVPQPPWRVGSALVVATTMGFAFCLWIEATYFASKGYFPGWAAGPIGAAFSAIQQWMERSLGAGNGSLILPVGAGLFQVLAALVAALLASRFYALSGLFAASVAGCIIAVFDMLFFSDDLGQLLDPANLGTGLSLLGWGAVPALPLALIVGWTKGRIARLRGHDRSGDAASVARRSRTGQRLLASGFVACLCLVVATGTFVKLRAAQRAAAELYAQETMAVRGDSDAQYRLGTRYLMGRGLPQAEQGYAAAQSNLGMMYRLGLGTPRDDGAAFALLRKAAEQGFAEAQYNLGQVYQDGSGVAKDEVEATVWLRRAAGQGYALAGQQLQVMCERGFGAACQR